MKTNQSQKNILSGWQDIKLGEVCDIIAGQSPEGRFYNNQKRGLPFYQGKKDFDKKFIGDPTVWTTKITKEAQKDDILMSVRAPVGPINFATQKSCIGRGLAAIRPGKNIDKDFLFYFLFLNEKEISGNTGAVFSSINKGDIENIEIPLPPLLEQHRIVKILDEVFENIKKAKENTEKNLQNSKELFESYLQSVFAKKGRDWEEKNVSEVCELKSGTTIPPKLEKPSGDVLYAKVGDMNLFGNEVEMVLSSRFIDFTDLKESQIIPEGSVIFPKRGGAIFTNKRRKIVKPTIVDLNTMALVPSRSLIPDFLYYWFLRIDLTDLTSGSSIPQINNYSFDNICISFPKSLSEQRFIVAKLDTLSIETKKLEGIYKQKLADLEELKKSVLKKAFSGDL